MDGAIIAVDVGTSGARAVVFDTKANTLAQVRKPYSMLFPQPGWNEQNPQLIVTSVIEALKDCAASLPAGNSLEAVVFSSQMYSILALDGVGQPLSNLLIWGDLRSVQQADRTRLAASNDLSQRTGCPIRAIYPLAKIQWLKANLDLPANVKFVSIKDYVLFRLTGELVADWSTASASGLLNISTCRWDDEALALCGITADNLPPLVSTRHNLGHWLPEVSLHTGIAATTPLIVGAGDAPLANIGVGAVDPGTLAINIGTSAAARLFTDQPQSDAFGRLFTYMADVRHWVLGGIIGSGGVVYEWLLRSLLLGEGDAPIETLIQKADALAMSAPAGAQGLLFLPYYSGEQSPGWNSKAKGLMYGMTLRHRPQHLVRAAIEGIVFSLLRVVKPIEEVRQSAVHKIYLTGGLVASLVWTQVIADVFGVAVVVPRSPESSARGAAILAWLTLGMADDYRAFAQPEALLSPNPEIHALYQQHYRTFCSLNDHLQGFFADQEIEP